jgi:hypothetical protein
MHDLLKRVDGFVAAKKPPPSEAFPKNNRHGEDVALLGADAPFVDALGRKIRKLSLHFVRSGDLESILCLGDAEVGEACPTIAADEDVMGRDIAMDNPEGTSGLVAQFVGCMKAGEGIQYDTESDSRIDRALGCRELLA